MIDEPVNIRDTIEGVVKVWNDKASWFGKEVPQSDLRALVSMLITQIQHELSSMLEMQEDENEDYEAELLEAYRVIKLLVRKYADDSAEMLEDDLLYSDEVYLEIIREKGKLTLHVTDTPPK